jgi:hypothetical protein
MCLFYILGKQVTGVFKWKKPQVFESIGLSHLRKEVEVFRQRRKKRLKEVEVFRQRRS